MSEPLLRMEHITKRFPGVLALDDVSLEILPGETHGLLGENGAGKSTLLKILSGAYRPDAGSIMLGGKPLELKTPLDAQKHGIVTIYQEFNLIPTMTVAENMFLGREPGKGAFVSWSRMRDETEKVLQHLNLDLDPMMPVSDLSVGEQQMVEIARALSRDSRIIVMDEPTAALTEREVEGLFRIVADLKARGLSIIYVTHRLHEVEQICDRVTVLRDGKRVGGGNVGELKIDDFVKMMVGRSSTQLFTRLGGHRTTGPIVMRAQGISRDRDPTNPHATLLKDVSIEVRAGEILGLAGLMGAGRTELARAIFGADPLRARLDRDRRQAAHPPLAGGRHPERHRLGSRGPQAAGLVPRSRGAPQPRDFHPQGPDLGSLVRQRPSRNGAGRALPQGARHPHGLAGHPDRRSLRRQSAESGAGALARLEAEGADRGRADARHRHRGQGGSTSAARHDGARRHRHRRHLLRTA